MNGIGKYDQHDRLKMCIGGTMDEHVQSDENVPDSEQQVSKCPTYRLNLVKCKDKNVPDSNQQGTKQSYRFL